MCRLVRRPPAAAAIRDGGVPVAYSSVSKFLKNMHVVRFSAHTAELIAQLIKVIKEHVKTYTRYPPPALALVALLIKTPTSPFWVLPRFRGRIIHAHKMAVHKGEIGFIFK